MHILHQKINSKQARIMEKLFRKKIVFLVRHINLSGIWSQQAKIIHCKIFQYIFCISSSCYGKISSDDKWNCHRLLLQGEKNLSWSHMHVFSYICLSELRLVRSHEPACPSHDRDIFYPVEVNNVVSFWTTSNRDLKKKQKWGIDAERCIMYSAYAVYSWNNLIIPL